MLLSIEGKTTGFVPLLLGVHRLGQGPEESKVLGGEEDAGVQFHRKLSDGQRVIRGICRAKELRE